MTNVYYGIICAVSKICHLTYGRKQNDVIKKTCTCQKMWVLILTQPN